MHINDLNPGQQYVISQSPYSQLNGQNVVFLGLVDVMSTEAEVKLTLAHVEMTFHIEPEYLFAAAAAV